MAEIFLHLRVDSRDGIDPTLADPEEVAADIEAVVNEHASVNHETGVKVEVIAAAWT